MSQPLSHSSCQRLSYHGCQTEAHVFPPVLYFYLSSLYQGGKLGTGKERKRCLHGEHCLTCRNHAIILELRETSRKQLISGLALSLTLFFIYCGVVYINVLCAYVYIGSHTHTSACIGRLEVDIRSPYYSLSIFFFSNKAS